MIRGKKAPLYYFIPWKVIIKTKFYLKWPSLKYLKSPKKSYSICFYLTAWKVSKYGVFSGPYFPVFGLNTYGDLLRTSPCSVQIQENTDQKKFRIWTFFTQCPIWKKSLDPKQGLAKSVNTKWHASPVQNQNKNWFWREECIMRRSNFTGLVRKFEGGGMKNRIIV